MRGPIQPSGSKPRVCPVLFIFAVVLGPQQVGAVFMRVSACVGESACAGGCVCRRRACSGKYGRRRGKCADVRLGVREAKPRARSEDDI